jgi:hypothetical protein
MRVSRAKKLTLLLLTISQVSVLCGTGYKVTNLHETELLTQSIRQRSCRRIPRIIGIRPGCPCGLGRIAAAVAILLWKLYLYPIETIYFSRIGPALSTVIWAPFRQKTQG